MTTSTTDERYCGHCDRDTQQRCWDDNHERDSTGDRRVCLTCGWVYSGLTGEWTKPPVWMCMHCLAEGDWPDDASDSCPECLAAGHTREWSVGGCAACNLEFTNAMAAIKNRIDRREGRARGAFDSWFARQTAFKDETLKPALWDLWTQAWMCGTEDRDEAQRR